MKKAVSPGEAARRADVEDGNAEPRTSDPYTEHWRSCSTPNKNNEHDSISEFSDDGLLYTINEALGGETANQTDQVEGED